ncbi:GDSL-type esterase/lipase family protein [Frankia sp. Cas3]|uniref:GDSL-type esterase/lipase family protein n=1 Tax=Frankia sp. Cas3 TaxID=3073926 RepID=UPI002AD25493|nr:GDSL-type esterase/lipase family protein [Frankia sp. Cas3]
MTRFRRLAIIGTALAAVGGCAAISLVAPVSAASQIGPRPNPVAESVPVPTGDVAALAVGTADGVDILVPADPATGGWRVLTSLYVQGWDTPQWTEFHCLTGDGRYMAVTFAPVAVVNDEKLRNLGAFAAIVDLHDGSRWIAPQRVAIKYHTPGCGTGTEVVFSRNTGTDGETTELIRVDAARRQIQDIRSVHGQIASAVPTGQDITAALGRSLITVDAAGGTKELATAPGPVYHLRPTGRDGVDFLTVAGPSTAKAFTRHADGRVTELAEGPLQNMSLRQGRGGANHLVGAPTRVAAGPDTIDVVTTPAQPVDLSLDGGLVIERQAVPGITAPTGTDDGIAITQRRRTQSQGTVAHVTPSATRTPPVQSEPARTGTVVPASMNMTGAPVIVPAASIASGAGSPCPIAPLDPNTQIIQPSPKQVEWAAGRAVRKELTNTRPANWQKHGLSQYTPQSMITVPALAGADPGKHIPVQILEGVLAQETNFSQASWHALPGVAGDPIIANYYGTTYGSDGLIAGADPAKADCGYGIAQITQHMKTGDSYWTDMQKRAIATDYEVNMVAAVRILTETWNQLQSLGLVANNADPTKIENWYLALWGYNTGVYSPGTGNPSWGLGWTNNPAQNDYDPSRHAFLSDYDDAAHPGRWPYQEKVLGWAQHAQLDLVNGGPKYTGSAALSLPTDYFLFCDTSNTCDRNSTSTGYCLNTDRKYCWWHKAVSWGRVGDLNDENPSAYSAGASEPTVANPYPPSCSAADSPVVQTPGTSALPLGAVIVDDLPDSSTNIAGCGTVTSSGSFGLSFGRDSAGRPVSAIDTHQAGIGYLGHSYFAHTVADSRGSFIRVTGRWTPPAGQTGWRRIWIHIPNNGADTAQADYRIYTGTKTYHRVVNQRWNKNTWFDLGSFQLSAGAYVSLSNVTTNDWDGHAVDISWDAVAFTPSSRPAVSYVAFGDSYQAGEGVEPYYSNSDQGAKGGLHIACHRSPQAYPNLVFNDLVALHPGNDEFHFAACSGAVVANVNGSVAHFSEVPQLDTGWLDENTTHVTIGIGGNDARFASILQACMISLHDCMNSDFHLTTDAGVDPAPLVQYEPTVIDGLRVPLTSLYQKIRQLAPNAQIIAVGYPHVVTTGDLRSFDVACSLIFPETADWFAQMADRLNQTIAEAAAFAGGNIAVVNPTASFAGPPHHEACTPATSDEWINAVVAHSSSGSGSNTPGSGSFHPDAAGHGAVASLIGPTLQ